MNKPRLRDACPTLSEPLRTGDGLLARLNLAATDLAPQTVEAIAKAAGEHGNGMLEVTARGNLQVRGLRETSASLFADDVCRLGIELPSRQITLGALAGIDADEWRDPRPLATALGAEIERQAKRLAPKFSAVVDGGGRLSLAAIKADIRLCAARDAWTIAVGGDAKTARHLATAKADDEALRTAAALLETIAERGNRARAHHLGVAELATFIDGSDPYAGSTAPAKPVGVFTLKDGRNALGVGIAFGTVPAPALCRLMTAAREAGTATVRMAPGRAIMMTGLSPTGIDKLRRAAERTGFAVEACDPRLRIATCAGAPACASGLFNTRQLAGELAKSAAVLLDGSLTLHLAGCGKRCAEPAGDRLSITGTEQGVEISLETEGAADSVKRTTAGDLAASLQRIAERCGDERREGESARDFLERTGIDARESREKA